MWPTPGGCGVQVQAEVSSFLKMLGEVYKVFGLEFSLALSTRPEGYLGELELWDKAEKALEDSLNDCGACCFRLTIEAVPVLVPPTACMLHRRVARNAPPAASGLLEPVTLHARALGSEVCVGWVCVHAALRAVRAVEHAEAGLNRDTRSRQSPTLTRPTAPRRGVPLAALLLRP